MRRGKHDLRQIGGNSSQDETCPGVNFWNELLGELPQEPSFSPPLATDELETLPDLTASSTAPNKTASSTTATYETEQSRVTGSIALQAKKRGRSGMLVTGVDVDTSAWTAP